ncbi:unnamed protein product [Lupinus luteus]|uniref:Retrovirus-related Pol polyprotein from transposon TNT 1-94-like beta-barrel domain-containing protein n=1 Tax=Lupinus luteus TaxID=3873 RepID=A0AAV1WTH0_LUPLU
MRYGSSFFCTHCNRPGHDISWCLFAPYNMPNPYPAYPYPYTPNHFNINPNINSLTRGTKLDHPSPTPNPSSTGQHYPISSPPYYPYYISPPPHHKPLSYPMYPPHPNYPPYAMNVSTGPSDPKQALWFPDLRATNYITVDPNLVHNTMEHFGPKHLYMGNGTKELISCSGTTTFSSLCHPNISLSLNNLLLVPTITKNLISVSQFAKDNHCFFEFHPNDCFVKSQDSKAILLHGSLTPEGLYAFKSLFPQTSSCYASGPTSSTQSKVVSKDSVLDRFSLLVAL